MMLHFLDIVLCSHLYFELRRQLWEFGRVDVVRVLREKYWGELQREIERKRDRMLQTSLRVWDLHLTSQSWENNYQKGAIKTIPWAQRGSEIVGIPISHMGAGVGQSIQNIIYCFTIEAKLTPD